MILICSYPRSHLSPLRSLSPWEGENSDVSADIDPDLLARHVLQDLVSRASYGHIKSLMMPLLYFIGNQKLWVPNKFPTHCMSLIMHSIQMQSAYVAISQLLAHLDEHKSASARLRCSIVEVVSSSVSIASAESIGPTLLEVFGALLKYLKISISTCNTATISVEAIKEEEVFQDAIVQAVGHFAHGLQTYQKIEGCTFILGEYFCGFCKKYRGFSKVYNVADYKNLQTKYYVKLQKIYKTNSP